MADATRKMLTRLEVLEGGDDRPVELHEFPEWGGWLRFRGMTGEQRDHVELTVNKGEGKQEISGARARVATYCIVNEDGSQMFTEGDVVALGKRSAKALARAFRIGARLSGMSDDALEEIEGNSNGVPSASSTSV